MKDFVYDDDYLTDETNYAFRVYTTTHTDALLIDIHQYYIEQKLSANESTWKWCKYKSSRFIPATL